MDEEELIKKAQQKKVSLRSEKFKIEQEFAGDTDLELYQKIMDWADEEGLEMDPVEAVWERKFVGFKAREDFEVDRIVSVAILKKDEEKQDG